MTLTEECIEALGKNITILDEEEKGIIMDMFLQLVPLTKWGRINWGDMSIKHNFKTPESILEKCEDAEYYIIWSDPTKPIIKSNLNNIIEKDNIYEVLAVAPNTWLLSYDFSSVIEFFHEGEITVGDLEGIIDIFYD